MNYLVRFVKIIGLVIVFSFLAGCGGSTVTPGAEVAASTPTSTLVAPSSTPQPPTATPTSIPPTVTSTSTPAAPTGTPTPVPPTATTTPTFTPTPSITAFGQAAAFEMWQIKVVTIDQVDSIDVLPFNTFQADKGYTIYLVELELENTSDTSSILTFDPQKIEVRDKEEKTYPSVGGSLSSQSSFVLHSNQVGGSISIQFGTTTFTATATSKEDKVWNIELPGKSLDRLTMAFVIPTGTQVDQLRWPEWQPFSLKEQLPILSNESSTPVGVNPQPNATLTGAIELSEVGENGTASGGMMTLTISQDGTSITQVEINFQSTVCSSDSSTTTSEDSTTYLEGPFPITEGEIEATIGENTLKGQFASPTEASGTITLIQEIFTGLGTPTMRCDLGTWSWSVEAK